MENKKINVFHRVTNSFNGFLRRLEKHLTRERFGGVRRGEVKYSERGPFVWCERRKEINRLQ